MSHDVLELHLTFRAEVTKNLNSNSLIEEQIQNLKKFVKIKSVKKRLVHLPISMKDILEVDENSQIVEVDGNPCYLFQEALVIIEDSTPDLKFLYKEGTISGFESISECFKSLKGVVSMVNVLVYNVEGVPLK